MREKLKDLVRLRNAISKKYYVFAFLLTVETARADVIPFI